jgi:hypothetical protein
VVSEGADQDLEGRLVLLCSAILILGPVGSLMGQGGGVERMFG